MFFILFRTTWEECFPFKHTSINLAFFTLILACWLIPFHCSTAKVPSSKALHSCSSRVGLQPTVEASVSSSQAWTSKWASIKQASAEKKHTCSVNFPGIKEQEGITKTDHVKEIQACVSPVTWAGIRGRAEIWIAHNQCKEGERERWERGQETNTNCFLVTLAFPVDCGSNFSGIHLVYSDHLTNKPSLTPLWQQYPTSV